MNVQTVREALRDAMPGYLPDWSVTLEVWGFDLNATKTVQIGHAGNEMATNRSTQVLLPVTLWVNESDQAGAVNDMYVAISREDGTFLDRLRRDQIIAAASVDFVGPRQEGPTGFIAADLTLTVRGDCC